VKILLFDLMDTLVRDPFFPVLGDIMRRTGLSRRDFRGARRHEVFEDFERGEVSEAEFFRNFYRLDLEPGLREVLPSPRLLKKRMFRSVSFLPEIPEILTKLAEEAVSRNFRLGIASNYSRWYREVLAHRPEIEGAFHYLFFSCELGIRKPEPDYYGHIETSLQRDWPDLRPEDILFLDDREGNLTPARERGWKAYLFRGGQELKQALPSLLDDFL